MTDMTYRARRQARADRLNEWAGKREAKATAGYNQAREMAGAIPFGQPMMPDHHSYSRDRSYRDRMHSTMDRAGENADKAASMRSRAANIEAAADFAIYSDDPDAIERLTEKIASLSARRDRIKAYNASCRKIKGELGDLSLLDDSLRSRLLSIARVRSLKSGAFPAYELTNLNGVINTAKKRLESLSTQ